MILTSSYSRVATEDSRAWLVSPNGEFFNCGSTHSKCLQLYPEIRAEVGRGSSTGPLTAKGWAHVGTFSGQGIFHIEVNHITNDFLRIFQEIASEAGVMGQWTVDITEGNDGWEIPYKHFRRFESIDDLRRYVETYG